MNTGMLIRPNCCIFAIFGIVILVNDIGEEEIGDSEPNRAFLAGYPRVSENDMLCSTSWIIHHKDSIDAQLITEKTRQRISEFGEGCDIAERRIAIKLIDENTSHISVGGICDAHRKNDDSYFTLFVKTFEFTTVEDPRVMCA